MGKLREILSNGSLGWVVAGIAILLGLWIFIRSITAKDTYDLAKLSERVTIRYADTGDEESMTRGELEEKLRQLGRTLKLDEGLPNPKTGKPTGVLVATREWTETIERLNAEREWAKTQSPFGAGAAGSSKKP
ncbi:MAG TPA: hypothetical protein VF777_10255 [Phycisphaerales bacterium]